MNAVADGSVPSAGDAFGTAEQTTGQRQGRSLVDTEPVRSMNFIRPMTELLARMTMIKHVYLYTCLIVLPA